MRRILTALAVATLVTGCSSGPDGRFVTPEPSVTASPTPTVTAEPTPEPPPVITLTFAGDVHFTGKTAVLLNNPSTAFGPVADIFSASDLAMINLETSVTTRGTPQPKTYTFRAQPSAYDAIKAAGIDAVSLGNNHVLDYGQQGLIDTLTYAYNAGVGTFGAGLGETYAYAPWITEVKGVRIAVFGFSQVNELSGPWTATHTQPGVAIVRSDAQIAKAAAAVRSARERADVVIAFMHWGEEVNPCPIDLQNRTARALADAGATMIIGAHQHMLQGDGWLGNTYVAHGLGNFVWYSNSSISYDTGVIRVTLTGSQISKTEFLPAVINRAGVPSPVDGGEAQRIQNKFANLRGCTGRADAPTAGAS